MKLDTVQVELRPRSAWEAMELGTALVRRHAGAIWKPWLWTVLPVFAVLNGLAWLGGETWMAYLALFVMWWLRPVFDRIPLYVLSRAVFGAPPRPGETLRAMLRWGWRPMRGHLTWRRLSPMRAVMLPVDLLEGAASRQLAERRRVIGGGVSGHAVMLTFACVHFIWALQFSLYALVLLFVPNESLPDFGRALWDILNEQPLWLLLCMNLVDVIATAIIEPFYVGAGFGLYLNRRTHLEAWDVEIAFRRMRQRLERAAAGTMLGVVLLLALLPLSSPARDCNETCLFPESEQPAAQAEEGHDEAHAADKTVPVIEQPPLPDAAPADGNANAQTDQTQTPLPSGDITAEEALEQAAAAGDAEEDTKIVHTALQDIFGDDTVDHDAFAKQVEKAYTNPNLNPKRQFSAWEPRNKKEKDKDDASADLSGLEIIGKIFGFIAENLLWFALAVLVLVLAVTARRWLPWMRGMAAQPEAEPPAVESRSIALDEPLPPDVPTAARALWREGQPRRALALLYRASVAAMTQRIDAHLPPGATEAECLRLSRKLPEEADRNVFQRVVRTWQYAAYGHRFPDSEDFESLLQLLSQRFGWQR